MLLQPKSNNAKSQRGGLLVEIVVVAGIIAGALVALLGLATAFLVTSQIVQQASRATALAQEGLEIVRNYRDGTDWAVDGLGQVAFTPSSYHPEQSGSPPEWTLVSGSETIDEFTREIMFEEVCRSSSHDIVACPGSYTDADTVQAVVTVSWLEKGRSHEVELEAYFTTWNQ